MPNTTPTTIKRRNSNTTLNQDYYHRVKIIASCKNTQINTLLEEGMRFVIDKYRLYLPENYKLPSLPLQFFDKEKQGD